jgi:hypothetical protein
MGVRKVDAPMALMPLTEDEIPIAYVMLDLARQPIQAGQDAVHDRLFLAHAKALLAQRFLCTWAAFQAICAALARRAGLRPRFELRRNGTMQTRRVGAVKIVVVHPPSDGQRIEAAWAQFDDGFRHRLIAHPGAAFFVRRKPVVLDQVMERDGFGQRLNGLVDVACTVDVRYPTWSPIDVVAYDRYMARGGTDPKARDLLARQIVDLLCTLHSNVLYGGSDAESGPDVIEHALPLLDEIVNYFVGRI